MGDFMGEGISPGTLQACLDCLSELRYYLGELIDIDPLNALPYLHTGVSRSLRSPLRRALCSQVQALIRVCQILGM